MRLTCDSQLYRSYRSIAVFVWTRAKPNAKDSQFLIASFKKRALFEASEPNQTKDDRVKIRCSLLSITLLEDFNRVSSHREIKREKAIQVKLESLLERIDLYLIAIMT